ncbi:MAG: 50S ribosomal protein L2, partial [Candidatus Thorarchaeota archaeon]|nr:50S ribosomal protein L2 [Candidatus Thorarchaeota archaeon]
MGKRIIVRRRGRGGIFKAPTHRRVSKVCYPSIDQKQGKSITAYVKRFVHDPGRGLPIALISLENGGEFYIAAPEGLSLNQKLSMGECQVEIGNILPLSKIP